MSFKDLMDDDLDLKDSIEKIAKDSFDKIIESLDDVKVQVKDVLADFEREFRELLKPVSDNLEHYEKAIDDVGGFESLFREAWNLEVEKVDILTFETVVKWAKQNINQEKHSAACLTETKKSNEYNLFFLDKNDKPLLNGSDKHKVFYTNMLDESLSSQLKDKTMLILK